MLLWSGTKRFRTAFCAAFLLACAIAPAAAAHADSAGPSAQIYVSTGGEDSGNLSVIGESTGAVSSTIPLNSGPGIPGSIQQTALSPQGDRLYVLSNDNTLSAYDPTDHALIGRLALPAVAISFIISPNGRAAYVLETTNIVLIDTPTMTKAAVIPDTEDPLAEVVSPDGRYLYVGSSHDSDLWVINTTTYAIAHKIRVGSGAGGANEVSVLISPDGSRIYVANSRRPLEAVVDTATDSTAAEITLPGDPVTAGLSPDGTHLYVATNQGGAYVSEIDTATDTITANVPNPDFYTAGVPGILFSPDSSLAYVVGNGDILMLDTATGAVTGNLRGDIPTYRAVTFSPDGKLAYAAEENSNAVSVIDTATGAVESTIPVGLYPSDITLDESGSHLYVSSSGEGSVSAIDTSTGAVDYTIPNTNAGGTLAISPDGTTAYVPGLLTTLRVVDFVTGEAGPVIALTGMPEAYAFIPDTTEAYAVVSTGVIDVIDTATETVSSTIPFPGGVTTSDGIAVTTDGRMAYISDFEAGSILAIDTATNTIAHVFQLNTDTDALAISPDGTRLYATNQTLDTVNVVDTATGSILATIPVGTEASAIAITPDGTHAYVANTSNGTVSVIDTGTDTVTATIPVGTDPDSIAVTPDGTQVYVANLTSDNVSVIDTTSNAVTATIPVGAVPYGLAIGPAV